jgi:hypothetical protein
LPWFTDICVDLLIAVALVVVEQRRSKASIETGGAKAATVELESIRLLVLLLLVDRGRWTVEL